MSPERANNWRVAVSSHAKRQIDRLPADERLRILEALDKLTNGPWQMHSSKLHGRPEWRLRIGGRRVLFLPDAVDHSLTVIEVGSRGDVYKDD